MGSVNLIGVNMKAKTKGGWKKKNKKPLTTNNMDEAKCECYDACAEDDEDYFLVSNKEGQLQCSCQSGILRTLKRPGKKKSTSIGWISEKARLTLEARVEAMPEATAA